MRQSAFVESRRRDWARLEELLGALEGRRRLGREGARELLRLYRRAAADLAEAQTRFPDSELRQELELLVGRAYAAVYRQPDEPVGASRLFAQRVPQAFRANLGYFGFALATFTLAFVLGAAIVTMAERWAELCLPPAAIESVRRGELWTNFFGLLPSSVVSTVVFYNNAMVCFSAFALGVTFGLGTLYVLFVNGLMLGSALSLCWRHGMLAELGGFVVGHGVIEISAILLAATGGLMLGDALARPGPYRRLDALRIRAREAATLAVGALPFLAAAALIEGAISTGDTGGPGRYALGLAGGVLMYAYLLTGGRGRARRPTGGPGTSPPNTSGPLRARGSRPGPRGNTPGPA